MIAILHAGTNDVLYETRPRYAFGRFYVEAMNQDSVAFLCPGEFIREAVKGGTACLRAEGIGLGWHYPLHLRRVDDGNVKGNIVCLNLTATQDGDTLDIVARLSVKGVLVQDFVVNIMLDSDDLAGIGPEYTEFSLS